MGTEFDPTAQFAIGDIVATKTGTQYRVGATGEYGSGRTVQAYHTGRNTVRYFRPESLELVTRAHKPVAVPTEAERIAKADKRYAMDYSARENGWATQGAADYCKRNGHATLSVDGEVQSYCPRCLEVTAAYTEVPDDVETAPDAQCAGCGSTEGHGRYDCGDDDSEALDPQGVSEWLDTIEARVHRDFSSQAGVQSHKVIVPVCPLSFGQDHARGILAVNPYAEGSHEWHAWGLGYDYGERTEGALDQWSILSGEWADSPTPNSVVQNVAKLQGLEPDDFYSDEFDDICEAYENGYDAYAKGWRV